MDWTVHVHPAVDDWLSELDVSSLAQVTAAVRELRQHGPALGRPLADTLRASRHRNMKELRPGSAGRSEIRILFAFDPARQAVLLVAGDKAGKWAQWYKRGNPAGGRQVRRAPRAAEGGNVMADKWRTWDEIEADARESGRLDEAAVALHRERMRAEQRAYRLAEIRRGRGLTQTDVAAEMKVSQKRVSAVERGQLGRTELGTVAAYVRALGGRVEIIADFGDERIVVG